MTVHFVLEEFKISLKSSLSTQSLCHTTSPGVGVGVPQEKQGLRIRGHGFKGYGQRQPFQKSSFYVMRVGCILAE